jgi:hypothetical protein
MNIPGEDVLSTSWHRVRDAGSAVGDLAGATLSSNANALMRTLPKVKDFVATGAGLAIARRGAKVALSTVKRNPVLAIARAVALAGAGAIYLAAKKRKAAQDAADDAAGKPRATKRLNAGSRRTSASAGATRQRAPARTTRQARPRTDGA